MDEGVGFDACLEEGGVEHGLQRGVEGLGLGEVEVEFEVLHGVLDQMLFIDSVEKQALSGDFSNHVMAGTNPAIN